MRKGAQQKLDLTSLFIYLFWPNINYFLHDKEREGGMR